MEQFVFYFNNNENDEENQIKNDKKNISTTYIHTIIYTYHIFIMPSPFAPYFFLLLPHLLFMFYFLLSFPHIRSLIYNIHSQTHTFISFFSFNLTFSLLVCMPFYLFYFLFFSVHFSFYTLFQLLLFLATCATVVVYEKKIGLMVLAYLFLYPPLHVLFILF